MNIRFRMLVGLLICPLCIESAFAQVSNDPFASDEKKAVPGSDPFAPIPQPNASKPIPNPPGSDPFGGPVYRRKLSPKHGSRDVKPVAVRPRQPFAISAVGDTDAMLHLEALLEQKTSQSYVETPLREAIQTISEMHGLPMVVDQRALEEIGLDADVGVSLDLKGVKLRTLIRLLLADLDCTYVIADEIVRITTKEDAERHKQVRFYRLPSALADRGELLVKAIETHVSPVTWQSMGGTASVELIDHVLIVSATTEVHYSVDQFLSKLHAAHSLGPAD